MVARVKSCPNCGAEVSFKASTSLLSVCAYCSSAVARLGDDVGELEILGKVAPLAELGSPLFVGARGRDHRRAFTLVGRLQLDYGAGPWNEWCAAFEDGGFGWIAEAQGKVYLSFPRASESLPEYAEAQVGRSFFGPEGPLVVTERRRATFLAAEGELPSAVRPGVNLYYADVEGAGGVFGTLDYGEAADSEPTLYLGRESSYESLFGPEFLGPRSPAQAAAAVGLNCPNCAAAVPLRAPDQAQRVTCPSCDALLDCNQGSELFLLSAARRQGPDPIIPIGAEGRLSGVRYVVYGHLVRSVAVEGVRYAWEEYLLRDEARGAYRWLIQSNDHFSFGEPVSSGEVMQGGASAHLGGKTYRRFSSGTASVEALRGEFYWKVRVGDQVSTLDFVAPPELLSRESSGEEVTWTRARYLEPEEVAAGFRLQHRLPRPSGVAPHQPNPHHRAAKSMSKASLVFSLALLVLAGVMALFSEAKVVFERNFGVEAEAKPNGSSARALPLVGTLTLEGQNNLQLEAAADSYPRGLFLEGMLVHELSQHAVPFGISLDPSDLSPTQSRTVHVGGLGSGPYAVTLKPEWGEGGTPPSRIQLTVREDVFLASQLPLFFLLLWLLPVVELVRGFAFERARWAESDFG